MILVHLLIVLCVQGAHALEGGNGKIEDWEQEDGEADRKSRRRGVGGGEQKRWGALRGNTQCRPQHLFCRLSFLLNTAERRGEEKRGEGNMPG